MDLSMPGKCIIGLTTQISSSSPLTAAFRAYLGTLLFFEVLGGIFMAIWGYEQSFLFLHQLHHPWLDLLMPHFTHLGDGVLLSGALMFVLIPQNRAMVIAILVGMVALSATMFLLKTGLFSNWERPPAVFSHDLLNWLSLGREVNKSFPSGHSAAAAAMATFWVLAYPAAKRSWGIFCGSIAALLAYSRLYIAAHFLGDILAGLVLGTVIAWGTVRFVYPLLLKQQTKMEGRNWKIGLYMFTTIFFIAGLVSIWNNYYA